MKKLLRLSLVALCAMVSSVAFADAYKTLTFPDDNSEKNKVNGYVDTWKAIIGKDSWSIANFNNYQWDGWTYIRCGRKSDASVASIATDFAIDQPISSVVVTFNKLNNADKVNSISLIVASDADFANVVETVEAPNKEAGDMIFAITNPKANYYYKLVFDCQPTGKNGNIEISKVQYLTGVSKKSADLKFSETYVEIEQGTTFTAPTFTKATNATVTFASDNEGVASVNSEGKITLGGELGSATITAKSEENDEYFAGDATCKISVFVYNTYKKATVITSGKSYLLVAQRDNKTYYAYPVDADRDYSYLSSGIVDGLTESIKVKSLYDDDFVFTEVNDGYTIQDCYGRYLYSEGKYNTFNVGQDPQTWIVEPQTDGTFKISMGTYFIQWGQGSFTTFGCWPEMQENAVLPYLYELDETGAGIDNITVEQEFDENAPVYNLQGQRVSKDTKGILIQNGKKFINR